MTTIWTYLGLNLHEERVDEAPSGERRVLTAAGYFLEPPNTRLLRFCRLSSASEALRLASALAWPRLLASYSGSPGRAAAVWMSPPGKPIKSAPSSQIAGLVSAISKACALRCWNAWRQSCGSESLPSWSSALARPGLMDWPLGIDLGIVDRLGLKLEFNAYAVWCRAQISSNRLLIKRAYVNDSSAPHSSACKVVLSNEAWWVWHIDLKLPSSVSFMEFAPPTPEIRPAFQRTDYLPFCSDVPVPSGHVDALLSQAQAVACPDILPADLRALLAQALGMSVEDLAKSLSEEQMDALWLAWKAMEVGRAFLLADETGYGKGRVLAALSRIAINSGYQVLFITERRGLLSDFWRDASVLFNGSPPPPTIAHSTARLSSPSGELVVPAPPRRPPQSGDPWVWTTYSQFNRKNPERLDSFLKWMKGRPTLLLLDESHNAASESATAKNLDKIQKRSSSVLYSSATFAKTESQLHGYRRLFEGSPDDWFRLMSAFDVDSDVLRTAITLSWAERGTYLRREHPPMPLPDAVWLPLDEKRRTHLSVFAAGWRAIYDCSQAFCQQYPDAPPPWLLLGGPLSRALREYAILDKAEDLVRRVCDAVSQDLKPVIVSDWTLSSHMARWLENSSKEDESDDLESENVVIPPSGRRLSSPPLWRESWKKFILNTFKDSDIEGAPDPQRLSLARSNALNSLDLWPDWTFSPFDEVRTSLTRLGIRVGEVSGRSWSLSQDIATGFFVLPRVDNRQAQVSDFNAGLLDVLLLTRAGNSGISLHAGRQFDDRRQRLLIEWDVAPDPSVRVQFWGRVRRRDQESEPLRQTLFLDTPSERRKYHREADKQRRLVAHGGSSSQTGTAWSGPSADILARLWCKDQPSAKLLGYNPTATQVFSRAIVLPDRIQELLVLQMDRGLSLMEDWMEAQGRSWAGESRLVDEVWWSGQGVGAVKWQDRVFEPRFSAGSAAVKAALSKPHQATASQVMVRWDNETQELWKTRPKQATPDRRRWREFWRTHHLKFERGMAVEAKDPLTGERVRGVVVDFLLPSHDWDASQVGMVVWLTTQPKPISLPIPLWFDNGWGDLRPLDTPASPAWFDVATWPVSARVLVGPPGQIAAWGIRQSVRGKLIRVEDVNGPLWGWKMPSTWTWNHALSCDRDLASTQHAQDFLRQRPDNPLFWKWSAKEFIQMDPQTGGLMLSGDEDSWNKMSFPMRKMTSRPTWTAGRFSSVISWKNVRLAFESLVSSGAFPSVRPEHAAWVQLSWPRPRGQ